MTRAKTMPCAICKEPMWKGRTSKPEGEAAHNACKRSLTKEQRVRTCIDCDSEFIGKAKRCNSCRYLHAVKTSTVKCTECEKPATTRGMCLTHYAAAYRAEHGRKRHTYSRECEFCGGGFSTTTKSTVHCSLVCAQRARAGWTNATAVVKYHRTKVWLGTTLSPRKGGALVAGQCAYCPDYFVGAPNAKYCSERCNMSASWKRRYERRGEFKVTDKLRLAVYERDAFTCQLCYEPVDTTLHHHDKMSATLDHIIPQSHMLIPDHSERNLRLAHRLCNSIRGDRVAA